MTLRFSPVRTADATAWAELLAAAEAVDATGEHYDADDLAEELGDALLDLERGSLGVWDGGRLAALAMVRCGPTGEPFHRMFYDATVHPAYRRQGLGTELTAWALRTAPMLTAERFPGAPAQLHSGVNEHNEDKAKVLRREGFEERRFFFGMQRDLTAPVTPAPAVDGVRVVPYDFAYDAEAMALRNEAFADHWGSTPQTPETWKQWYTGTRTFRPDLSFLALAGTELVSFLLAHYYEADTVATGRRDAYIGTIGTGDGWRRRGLGSTLIAACLTEARQQGFDTASLGVDAGNRTGALSLYETAGFEVEHRHSRFVLDL